jgi:hypothetical protein
MNGNYCDCRQGRDQCTCWVAQSEEVPEELRPMKNKTVTLSREPVAWVSPDVTNFSEGERQWVKIPASLVEDRTSGHTVPLYAALADPVPPAGGEVEVLGWRVESHEGRCLTNYTERPDWAYREDMAVYTITELVDRAHVTRLQAEVERSQCIVRGQRTTIDTIQLQVETLQSELTKAREYIQSLRGVAHTKGGITLDASIDAFLAHQSVPAAKDGE